MSHNKKVEMGENIVLDNIPKEIKQHSVTFTNNDNYEDNSNEEINYYKQYCIGIIICFTGITSIGVLIGTLILYAFTIYSLSLISSTTIHKHCSNSYIWDISS